MAVTTLISAEPVSRAHATAMLADGAVDVTDKTPQYAYRGSRELVLRLCSGGNNYNGVCPRYIVTEGAQAVKLGKIEVQGDASLSCPMHAPYALFTLRFPHTVY